MTTWTVSAVVALRFWSASTTRMKTSPGEVKKAWGTWLASTSSIVAPIAATVAVRVSWDVSAGRTESW
jgi:hypothetical protein